MKLSKKVLAAFSMVAALAMAGTFVACSDDDEDAFNGGKVNYSNERVFVKAVDSNGDVVDYTSYTQTSQVIAASGVTVEDITKVKDGDETLTKKNYANLENNSYFYRAFKKTSTKHRGGICEIVITPNGTSTTAEGVGGFVFDLVDGSVSKTYSFLVAAVHWTGSALETYVSRYTDVAVKDNNYTAKQNFTDGEGVVIGENTCTAKEAQITPTTGYWDSDNLTDFKKAGDGTITVVIKVGATEAQADGSYTVGYYIDVDTARGDGENDFTNAKKTVEVKTENTNRTDAKTQAKLAYYVNILAGKKFTANFDWSKTFGEAVVFEDGIVEN